MKRSVSVSRVVSHPSTLAVFSGLLGALIGFLLNLASGGKTSQLLWIALVFSIMFSLSLTAWQVYRQEQTGKQGMTMLQEMVFQNYFLTLLADKPEISQLAQHRGTSDDHVSSKFAGYSGGFGVIKKRVAVIISLRFRELFLRSTESHSTTFPYAFAVSANLYGQFSQRTQHVAAAVYAMFGNLEPCKYRDKRSVRASFLYLVNKGLNPCEHRCSGSLLI